MDGKIAANIKKFVTSNLLVIVITILLVVTFVLLYKSYKSEEGFGPLYTQQTAFTTAQRTEFWDKTNKQLDYNSELQKDMENDFKNAVKSIDPMTNKTAKNNLDIFFRKDPLESMKKKDINCSSAKEPSQLPPHSANVVSGCGWWYIDDDNKSSFAANGSKLGPYSNLSVSSPTGQWVWDLQAAQRMEDAKRCRKIKSCDVADLVPGRCGFCNITGTGVPIDRNGNAKYPDDSTLVCPENVITNPKSCPKPDPIPITMPDGTIVVPSPNTPVPNICDPVNGRLSIECLKFLAAAAGITEDGAIMKVLNDDSDKAYKGKGIPNSIFNKALEILKSDANINTDKAFLADGICSRDDALSYYKKVNKTISSGKTTRAKDVARYLCLGTEFDPCDYDPDQSGPFELFCLERVAREKGCQPDGRDYPTVDKDLPGLPDYCRRYGRPSTDGRIRVYTKTECDRLDGLFKETGECTKRGGGSFSWDCRDLNKNPINESTKSKYDRMKWKDVNFHFGNIHKMTLSTDQNILEEGTQKCLGVTVNRKAVDCDDMQGCEVLWYSWDYEWDFPDKPASSQTFYGREIKANLPSFNTGGSDYNPYNIQNRMSFKLRSNIVSKTSYASKFWVMTDDGVAFRVNNSIVQKNWNDQGPSAYETTPFILSSEKPTKLEAYWYQNYGGSTFIPKLMYDGRGFDVMTPSELQISVPKSFPICRWDFYSGSGQERNNVLTSSIDASLGSLDGKKCAVFASRSGVAIKNSLRGGAASSFTFMAYHRGGWARLFALRKGDCSTGAWSGYSIEGGLCSNSRVWFAMQKEGGNMEVWVATQPQTVPKNAWFHIAFCLDDDFRGVTIFVDAKKVGRARNENMNGDEYKENIYNRVSIGHAGWDCNPPITPPPAPSSAPVKQGYEYKGCWADTATRALPTRLSNVNSVEACYNLAKQNNFSTFGLQFYGECWAGNNKDWNKYGKRDNATCGELGVAWVNQIYTVGASPPPDCPPSSEGDLDIGLAWAHFFDYSMNRDDVQTDRVLGFTNDKIYAEDPKSGWKQK